MTGRVSSESSRTGQALGWPGLARLPFQGLNSAVALVFCDGTGGSEPLAHDEWGGLLPYFGRNSLRPEGMGRNHLDRDRRCTILCMTNGCLLPHRRPMVRYLVRLGAYTNLSWARNVSV